jgi:hypothetical protein
METNVIAVNFKNKHIVDTEPLTFEEVSRLAREQAETVPVSYDKPPQAS